MNNEKTNIRDPATGRFVSEYNPDYDDLLIKHLADGLSYRAFAGVLGVHHGTLYDWEAKYPSFKEAKEIGENMSLLFWEKMGMAGTVGKIKNFNTASWIFNMKNRFRWRDRHEVKTLTGSEDFVSHDKIMEYIEGKTF